jgi:hypothetical protein
MAKKKRDGPVSVYLVPGQEQGNGGKALEIRQPESLIGMVQHGKAQEPSEIRGI